MNELGITFVWLAVQVTLVLAPALGLLALASRRSPASGAWISTLSLGLIVVLSVVGLAVGPGREAKSPMKQAAPNELVRLDAAWSVPPLIAANPDRPALAVGLGWQFRGLRLAWARLEGGAAELAARVRPWGSLVAVFTLGGMGFSLVRLLTGLWAIRAYRRRGSVVDDAEMTGLLGQLRDEMGCVRTVELRQVDDLTTPATAGWRQPVLLLPDDWRSWKPDERRAVLAHELAHVVRGDYATGLVARIALVLNTYHPLVRWMAGRLQLQQEQAADALAARFVGGPASYLVILARLALQQNGRSPRWPAREFLADRGTLLRRIAMLRDQSETGSFGRRSPGASRPFASLALVGLTIGVATLRGPARAAEDDAPAAATSAKTTAQAVREPFVTLDLINNQEAERTYKIGAYYKKVNKVASAEFHFGKIPQRWPNSPWADKARIELAQLARMSRKSVLP